ncbi:MAG: D-alanine--D-alanine ligase [Planctomycetota bacterium]
MKPIALVLAGGPDAERAVSIDSASAVAGSIASGGLFESRLRVIDRPASLAEEPGDVVVPVLHGPWGEGGPLQDLLEADGRPYVGCRPDAARLCMDKLASKRTATHVGLRTPPAHALVDPSPSHPIEAPAVIKPIRDGSSVNLHMCHDRESLERAREASMHAGTPMMIEKLIAGREITCGLIDTGLGLRALPLIEIIPAEGVYDYEAKYDRDDTRYVVGSRATPHADHARVQADSLVLASALGVRHLARADFIVDDQGEHHLLEINTMPGFTGHSLLPKAASALGISMATLCTSLCEVALAEHSSPRAVRADDAHHGANTET